MTSVSMAQGSCPRVSSPDPSASVPQSVRLGEPKPWCGVYFLGWGWAWGRGHPDGPCQVPLESCSHLGFEDMCGSTCGQCGPGLLPPRLSGWHLGGRGGGLEHKGGRENIGGGACGDGQVASNGRGPAFPGVAAEWPRGCLSLGGWRGQDLGWAFCVQGLGPRAGRQLSRLLPRRAARAWPVPR